MNDIKINILFLMLLFFCIGCWEKESNTIKEQPIKQIEIDSMKVFEPPIDESLIDTAKQVLVKSAKQVLVKSAKQEKPNMPVVDTLIRETDLPVQEIKKYPDLEEEVLSDSFDCQEEEILEIQPSPASELEKLGEENGRFKRIVKSPTLFMPKGQWLIGASFSYSEHQNKNYKFLIIDDWDGMGYSVNTDIYGGYTFRNEMMAGMRFGYNRSLLSVDGLNLSINEDLNFGLNQLYNLQHSFYGIAFLRNYISMFNSKRFGLFNEIQLKMEMGQGKLVSGTGESLTGTYQTTSKMNIGVAPGMTVFITDNTALEVSIGLVGFQSSWIKQNTNQIDKGSRHASSAKFKIDLFSIKIGMAFYMQVPKFNLKNVK